jgi:NAD(P)-dependent dehydrogenase (short-subunit alcohol dehydrogenase family)
MATRSVAGKVVLITGAGAGFGRKTAETLAADGAKLVLTDLNEGAARESAARCESLGAQVVVAAHDVASEVDWSRVIKLVETEFGHLDGLVNNAGYMLTKPYLQTSLAEFRRIHQVNVESIWIGTQLAFPLLQKAAKASTGGASVINVSSVFGQVAGFAQSAYCATKGAVRLLTKSQAVEFARMGSGVRVNSVHPGPGNTGLAVNGVQEAVAAGLADSPEALIGQLTAMIPLGRFSEAEDVADLVHFLCSDASRYMTGAEFTVDGGYTAT